MLRILITVQCCTLVAACAGEPATRCDNGDLCPDETVCVFVVAVKENRCFTQNEITSCNGRFDGTSCEATAGLGECRSGGCLKIECGNRITEVGLVDEDREACDDGNFTTGDGCSADCKSIEVCGNGELDLIKGEQCDSGIAGLSNDGCTSTCQVEAATWTQFAAQRNFARRGFASAYDSNRQEFILFGGVLATDLDDTLVFRDVPRSVFTKKRVLQHPSARRNAAMGYDSKEKKMLLFGGAFDGTPLSDTWMWDGERWQKIEPAGMLPPASLGPVMVFDQGKQRLLLVTTDTQGVGSTWAWHWGNDAQSDPPRWTRLSGANAPGRNSAAITSTETCVLMFGGDAPNVPEATRILQDLWQRCNDTVGWVPLTQTSAPPARRAATLTYIPDAQTGVPSMVLIGGETRNSLITNSLRSLTISGTTATWQTVSIVAPPPEEAEVITRRAAHGAFANGSKLYIVGGIGENRHLADVQRLQFGLPPSPPGLEWISKTPQVPQNVRAPAATYDPLRGSIVMIGPDDPDPSTGVSATPSWRWDGFSWEKVSDGAPAPLQSHGLALRTSNDGSVEFLVFGGVNRQQTTFFGDTFVFNGSSWQSDPSMSPPSARARHSLVFDQARNVYVLFGGHDGRTTFGDTWERRKATTGSNWEWVELTPPGAHPAPRYHAAMAYFPRLGKTFLFGGLDLAGNLFNDVWSYDGTQWRLETTLRAPSPRSGCQFTYDPKLGKLILFGGETLASIYNDTYTFDGTTWQQLATTNAPPARSEFVLTYDARNRATLLFGGVDRNTQNSPNDLWYLQLSNTVEAEEECLSAEQDSDNDGLRGCADPDCWSVCDPLCLPGQSCPSERPKCGDNKVTALETQDLCPQDFAMQ